MSCILAILPFIFPTRARSKIPKSLTYPLKAKAIWEALADVPQGEELGLWFSTYDMPAKLRRRTYFSLVQARYSHREVDQFTSHDMEESGHNDPNWTIQIYAIPIEIRTRVTQTLHDEALPQMRAWLLANADVENRRSCSIEIFYNKADDEIESFKRET